MKLNLSPQASEPRAANRMAQCTHRTDFIRAVGARDNEVVPAELAALACLLHGALLLELRVLKCTFYYRYPLRTTPGPCSSIFMAGWARQGSGERTDG